MVFLGEGKGSEIYPSPITFPEPAPPKMSYHLLKVRITVKQDKMVKNIDRWKDIQVVVHVVG